MNDLETFANADEWEDADDLGPGWKRGPDGRAFYSSDWLTRPLAAVVRTEPGETSVVVRLPAAEEVGARPVRLLRTIGRPDGMTVEEARHYLRKGHETLEALGPDLSGIERAKSARILDSTGRRVASRVMPGEDEELRYAELAAADAARVLVRKLERLRELYAARGRREGGLQAALLSTTGLEASLR